MNNSEQNLEPATGDRLLRAREVANMLGVGRATAYRMMANGTLPAVRFGPGQCGPKTVRVRASTLMAWMKRNESGGSSGES